MAAMGLFLLLRGVGEGDSCDFGDGAGVQHGDDALVVRLIVGVDGDEGLAFVGVGGFLEPLERGGELVKHLVLRGLERLVVQDYGSIGLDFDALLVGDVHDFFLGDGAGQADIHIALLLDRLGGDHEKDEQEEHHVDHGAHLHLDGLGVFSAKFHGEEVFKF